MGNSVSKVNVWLEATFASSGLHRIRPSSKENKPSSSNPSNSQSSSNVFKIYMEEEKKTTEKEKLVQRKSLQHNIPENLNALLSAIIKEKLQAVLDNKSNMGIKDSNDFDYSADYPKLVEGTIAAAFQTYLKDTISEDTNLKFSFLIITELVLVSHDSELYHHLASTFFNEQSKFDIKLSNEFAQERLYQYLTEKNFLTNQNQVHPECLKLLREKGKEGDEILSLNGGLHTIYEDFREHQLRERSRLNACLLSIL